MDDDWGLQAVVRSCAAATTSSSTIPSPSPPPLPPVSPPITTQTTTSDALNLQSFSTSFRPQLVEANNFICFQDLFEPREEKDAVIEELHELCKPFFFPTSKPQTVSPQSVPVSPLSVLGCFQDLSSQPQPQPQPQQQQQQQLLIQRHIHHPKQQTSSICEPRKRESSSNTHNPRSKKRKNQMKKVLKIPAEGLSSDMWSWRKYGQKPIKGSPYPRGYYKCSTSKGCMARKQVERDRSNPNMLIVTYTGEHNHPVPTHRNSLAGSTRQKAATTTSDDPNKPSTPSVDSPAAEKLESIEGTAGEEEDDDDDDFDISNMPLDDDFFAGLDEELVSLSPSPNPNPGPEQGPSQSDCFPATQFQWLSNNVTTTAAGSG